jgi:hypothetical protein
MTSTDSHLVLLVALIAMTAPAKAHAVLIDVSGVEFTGIVPNPIAPGERPTSIAYKYHYNKESASTVSASFGLTITFSSNATFGDPDDFTLGTLNTATAPVGGNSGDVMATTSNPNGISSFQVPPTTLPGEYSAFLSIAPRTPHFDPDAGDAFGQLPGTVTVALAVVPGDYDGDRIVNGADLAVWAGAFGQSGSGLPADGDEDDDVDGADFLIWQRHLGTGPIAIKAFAATPEPSAAMLVCLAGAALSVVRRGGGSLSR